MRYQYQTIQLFTIHNNYIMPTEFDGHILAKIEILSRIDFSTIVNPIFLFKFFVLSSYTSVSAHKSLA